MYVVPNGPLVIGALPVCRPKGGPGEYDVNDFDHHHHGHVASRCDGSHRQRSRHCERELNVEVDSSSWIEPQPHLGLSLRSD